MTKSHEFNNQLTATTPSPVTQYLSDVMEQTGQQEFGGMTSDCP